MLIQFEDQWNQRRSSVYDQIHSFSVSTATRRPDASTREAPCPRATPGLRHWRTEHAAGCPASKHRHRIRVKFISHGVSRATERILRMAPVHLVVAPRQNRHGRTNAAEL